MHILCGQKISVEITVRACDAVSGKFLAVALLGSVLCTEVGYKRALGCVNSRPAAGFTQPRAHLIARLCTYTAKGRRGKKQGCRSNGVHASRAGAGNKVAAIEPTTGNFATSYLLRCTDAMLSSLQTPSWVGALGNPSLPSEDGGRCRLLAGWLV